jgi:hypothetical protein
MRSSILNNDIKGGLAKALSVFGNSWVEGFLMYDKHGVPYIITNETSNTRLSSVAVNAVSVEKSSVCLYTGTSVKQADGSMKKLFTGDIIFARGDRLLVDFDMDFLAFWTYYFSDKGEKVKFVPLSDIAPWEWGSIVGNIVDNPGLMGKGYEKFLKLGTKRY